MIRCSLEKMIARKLAVLSSFAVLAVACDVPPENQATASGEVEMQTSALNSACVIGGIAFGPWYSQNDTRWKSIQLGNNPSETIGASGCYLTALSMIYNDAWGVPTTPAQLNASAKSAGCFGSGSAYIVPLCAINSRGGPHAMPTVASTADVRTAICAGYPVIVHVGTGDGHYMVVYYYNGGDQNSLSSYLVVDPWNGQSKSLSGYSVVGWNKFY